MRRVESMTDKQIRSHATRLFEKYADDGPSLSFHEFLDALREFTDILQRRLKA
jgi:hypothetical protein